MGECKFKNICPIHDAHAIPCLCVYPNAEMKVVDYERHCIPKILEYYNKSINLSEDERKFLMGCMAISNGEGMYLFDRRYTGFKNNIDEKGAVELLKKLGATEENIEEYHSYG